MCYLLLFSLEKMIELFLRKTHSDLRRIIYERKIVCRSLVCSTRSIENLPTIDYNDNKTFFDYANTVLLACEFETLDEAWVAAEEYAEMSDLTMAEEMKAAIRYKKKHPWMLSYPIIICG